MTPKMLTFFLLIQFGILINLKFIYSIKGIESTEYNLFKSKFENYSKSVRPVNKWDDVLKVDINVKLKKIATVIEDHQTMSIYVRLEMIWKDINLVWDPKDFDGVQSIFLPADQLWIPDIHLFNSASEDDRIYPLNVEVFANGTVVSFPINHLYAHCDFDFTRFPYDIQKCDFLIGSMVDRSKVSVSVRTYVEMSRILPNPEWKFLSFSDPTTYVFNVPGTNQAYKDSFNMNWSVSKFTLALKRSSTFYVNLFVWPIVFILFVTMSVFILPPSCVERASLGVLLLLSVVILSLMLESYMPKTTANVSIIGKLIGFCMFMVTSATVASTLIISVDRDNFVYRTIPSWLRNFMGKMVFKYGSLNQAIGENNLIRDEDIEVIDTSNLIQRHEQNSNNQPLINTGTQSESTSSTAAAQSGTGNSLDMYQAQTLLVLINNQLAMFRMRLQEGDHKEKNRNDWYLIATVLDRFCLICYTVIMLLGLFIVLI